MSAGMAVRVIDALDEGLGNVKKICVHIYGGEPFTNLPAVEAMVDRALEKQHRHFTFAVTTNGTILSDAVIDVLKRGRFQVLLSIDGPAEIHDQCRRRVDGSPTHKDVIRFLETVRAETPCPVWGAAVIRSGWRLAHANEYLRTLPIHHIKAQAVRLPAGAPWALTPGEWDIYKEDLEIIGRQVIKDLEQGKVPMDHRFSGRVLQLLVGGDKMSFCDAGKTNFGITPSGDVLACLLVEDPMARLGHIDDEPTVWREAGLQWKTRPLREKCRTCENLPLCGGGCPAVISVCDQEECDVTAKNCSVARDIYRHFQDNKEALLGLVGLT
jgi:uncharacterized protein